MEDYQISDLAEMQATQACCRCTIRGCVQTTSPDVIGKGARITAYRKHAYTQNTIGKLLLSD